LGAAADAAAAAAPTVPSNRSSSSTRNYEVSRTVTATQNPSSRVTRVSAAVLIQAPAVVEGEEGPTGPDLASLEQLARSAIGFNEERGDSVTILSQTFQPTAAPSISSVRGMTWLPDILRQVAIVAALAIVGLGVVRPILDRVLVPVSETMEAANHMHPTAIEVGEGESLSDVRKRLNTRRASMTDAALNRGIPREERFAVVRQLAAEDPARIANVLHRMMSEEIDQVS
jgi:flagellar M-ring protein FliF